MPVALSDYNSTKITQINWRPLLCGNLQCGRESKMKNGRAKRSWSPLQSLATIMYLLCSTDANIYFTVLRMVILLPIRSVIVTVLLLPDWLTAYMSRLDAYFCADKYITRSPD